MTIKKITTYIAGGVLFAGLLAGCAAEQRATQHFYWPQLPERPRIEWLNAYSSQLDFPKVGARKFMSAIAGEEEPVKFDKPIGIKSDGKGKVYISDSGQSAVLVYDMVNYDVHIFGRENAPGLFKWPLGIEIDAAGNIYVGDVEKGSILVFTGDEKPLRAIELKDSVERLGDFVLDKTGRIIAVDPKAHKVLMFSPEGKLVKTIGERGEEDGKFNFPVAIAQNHKGEIIVGDSMNARIQIFDSEGKFLRKFGTRGDGPADFQLLKGVAVDSDDNIYVTEGKGHKLIIFNTNGEWLLTVGGQYSALTSGRVAPGGFMLPQGIDIDQNDKIFIVDQLNKRFQLFQYMSDSFVKAHPIEGYTETK
jgi:sugar lactone lactonase YvrE